MRENVFDPISLLPKLGVLIDWEVGSPHFISSFFAAVLFCILLLAIRDALSKFWGAKGHVAFFSKLLDGVTEENLVKKQHELRSTAKANTEHGLLWLEFDESLVSSQDGEKLYNTLDASHFFNTHNLARGLTEKSYN